MSHTSDGEDGQTAIKPLAEWSQRELYRHLRAWWQGLGLEHKGVDLGDCLSFDLIQLWTRRAGRE